MITHREIENEEIVERYVRSQLDAEKRRAFEEHFFVCDECFANVQTTERFILGVKHAAEIGLLAAQDMPARNPAFSALPLRWPQLAFVLTAAACLVLTAVVGWLSLMRLPQLREEIARERQTRERLAQQKQREIDELNARLQSEDQSSARSRQERTGSETPQRAEEQEQSGAVTSRHRTESRSSEMVAANVPVVVLQATRAFEQANELQLQADTHRFRLWIEVGPRTKSGSFRIEVLTADGRPVQSLRGLKLNSQNALSVVLSAQTFKSGGYLLQLYSVNQKETTLVSEHKLLIERK